MLKLINAEIYSSMHMYANLQKHAQVGKIMLKYAQVYKSTNKYAQRFVKACTSMLKPAQVC